MAGSARSAGTPGSGRAGDGGLRRTAAPRAHTGKSTAWLSVRFQSASRKVARE